MTPKRRATSIASHILAEINEAVDDERRRYRNQLAKALNWEMVNLAQVTILCPQKSCQIVWVVPNVGYGPQIIGCVVHTDPLDYVIPNSIRQEQPAPPLESVL